MIATSVFLTALECTKFVFGQGWGSLQRSPDPLAGLRGPTFKGEGEGREREKGDEKGRGREWRDQPPYANS